MNLDDILNEQNAKLDNAMAPTPSSGQNGFNFDEHMQHFDQMISGVLGQASEPEAAPAVLGALLPKPTQYPTLQTAPAPREDMRYKYFNAPPASAAVTAPKLPGNYAPNKVTSNKETPATLPQAFSAPKNLGK